MNRKVRFDVGIADDFDETNMWPKPLGMFERKGIDIEFMFLGSDIMDDAEKVLREFMMENYPNKKYKIYYWTWLDKWLK